MEQSGTFINGILNAAGEPCRDFIVVERTFRHTLLLANDKTLDKAQLDDPVYTDAAMIAKRITVTGLPDVTPEMILALEGEDGDVLSTALYTLDQRRAEFRNKQQVPPQDPAGTP